MRDAARGRIDACHRLPAELDAVLHEVAVGEPDLVGRLAAEHHLELREAEEERVVAIDQRDADRVRARLREPGRELQPAEPGSEDQDVLSARRPRYFTAALAARRGSRSHWSPAAG